MKNTERSEVKTPVVPLEIRDNIMHNVRIKIWPDGSREAVIAERAIFREPGWEVSNKWDTDPAPLDLSADGPEAVELSQYAIERGEAAEAARAADNLDRAKRRARGAVYDLAMASNLRYFVTLTLNAEKVNRYDIREITRKLNAWLDNQVRRRGLAYVLVPERHKDGAVHFHGFFNDALPVVDSGHKDSAGHPVFNLPAWTLGFTTAIELYGDRAGAVGYCCKYIAKAQEKVGGRWYYSGGALDRPRVEFADVPFRDFVTESGAREFQLAKLGMAAATLKIDAPEGKLTNSGK